MVPGVNIVDAPPADARPLDHEQRAHLIKKTRKLAKVFGITPALRIERSPAARADSQDETKGVLHRSHSVGTPSTATLVDAMDGLTPRTTSMPSTPMHKSEWAKLEARARDTFRRCAPRHLHLKPVAIAPRAPGARADPASPTFLVLPAPRTPLVVTPATTAVHRVSFFPPTPMSASCESSRVRAERERRQHRRRLSKLARTFGQSVPPVLVIPPGDLRSTDWRRNIRKRRSLYISLGAAAAESPVTYFHSFRSAVSVAEYPTDDDDNETYLYDAPPATWQAVSKAAFKGEKSADAAPVVVVIEAMPSPEPSPLSALSFAPPSSSPGASPDQHATSVHSPPSVPACDCPFSDFASACECAASTAADAASEHEISSLGHGSSQSGGSPRLRLAQRLLGIPNAQRSPAAYAHRSERRQGWSGEWNAASVQEVISKLRELK